MCGVMLWGMLGRVQACCVRMGRHYLCSGQAPSPNLPRLRWPTSKCPTRRGTNQRKIVSVSQISRYHLFAVPRSHRILIRFGIAGIIITSLDDDEYDGDDEGQQRPRSETKPTAQESEFTISPAFLNAINKKLTRSVDHPAPPLTDTSTTQALVLFRPLPAIAPPPTNGELEDCSHKEGELDRSPQKPFPSESPFFYVQDSEPPSFVPNDDAMEIEML